MTPVRNEIAAPPSTVGTGFDDADYHLFAQKVRARTQIRLSDYKPEQMRRRIGSMAQRAGYGSFLAYFAAMERNAALLDDFQDKITINVSEVLRNPNRFDDLARAILPSLLARRVGAGLSVWSAGCSYGAEAFTLAMLLHEIAPSGLHRIKGTDIDKGILEKACRARFSETDITNLSPARRIAYFSRGEDGFYVAARHLRARVEFARHDLLADPYPRAAYDLIACRNVVIYFTDGTKERVYHGFYQALRPGGVLFVGGTERLVDHRALGFELVLPFFYRKLGV